MSKLSINLKMDIVAVAICPVVETLIGARRSLKTTEPLDHFISIEMFNEMIDLYNEKHKDDDKIMLSDNKFNSVQDIIDNKINSERRK